MPQIFKTPLLLSFRKIKSLISNHGLLCVVLFFTVFIYYPGLNGPLILDDLPNLKPMLMLVDGELTWLDYIKRSGFGWHDRPVSILSFLANFTLTGSNVFFLKSTSLIIHLICGILIYCFFQVLLSQKKLQVSAKARSWIVLWIVSAWLFAPIHVSTTLYVIQRMAQLSTMFMLAGMLCYVVGRQRIKQNRRYKHLPLIIAFTIFWPLAIFSKENGIIFPLLILIIELFFFQKINYVIKKDKFILYIFSALILIPLSIYVFVFYDPTGQIKSYDYRDFTLYERVLTQFRILVDYVLNILMIPGGSGMGLFHDDYQKSTSLFSPITTFLSLVLWSLIIIYGLYKYDKRQGYVLFGLIFFLSANLIESSYIALEMYFEHRNYLPSIGVFFTVALGIYYLAEKSRIRNLIFIVMYLVIVSYGFFTTYRVDIWRSWDSILLASQNKHPDSLRVQRGLVVVYTQRGELEKALNHLSKIKHLAMSKERTAIDIMYLMAYCSSGQYPPEDIYERFNIKEKIPEDHYTGTVFFWFVEAIEAGECFSLDMNRVLKIVQNRISYEDNGMNYNKWVQVVLLARLYASQSNWVEARHYINKAIELRPNTREKYINELKQYYDSM